MFAELHGIVFPTPGAQGLERSCCINTAQCPADQTSLLQHIECHELYIFSEFEQSRTEFTASESLTLCFTIWAQFG